MDSLGFDRLPPNSLEAEMCMLASMMLDGEMVDRIRRIVPRGIDCYSADNGIIFDTILRMRDTNKKVDAVILREELLKAGLLEEVGGAAYIAQILGTVPSAAHGEHYAQIVQEKATLRGYISIANEMLREAYAPHIDDGKSIGGSAMAKLENLNRNATAINYVRIDEIVKQFIDNQIAGTGDIFLPFGLETLDKIMYGFPMPGTSVVGARQGMGKSVFGKQACLSLATIGVPTLLIAVEETSAKIAANMISYYTGINSKVLFRQKWDTKTQFDASLTTGGVEVPFYVTTTTDRISDICVTITEAVKRTGIRFVVIDHIHLVDPENNKDNREQQISKMSKRLKALAKKLDIHICICAQLNKGGGGRENYSKRPFPSELRDSGSLAEDADLVIMFHRTDYYNMQTPDYSKNRSIEVYIHKQKYTGGGQCVLYFDAPRSKISEWPTFFDWPDDGDGIGFCEKPDINDLYKF